MKDNDPKEGSIIEYATRNNITTSNISAHK